MRDMIHHIVKSGELERFWTTVEKENLRVKKEAKREFQDRQRLEKGSEADDTEPITETDESYDEEEDHLQEQTSEDLAPYLSQSSRTKQEGFQPTKIEFDDR